MGHGRIGVVLGVHEGLVGVQSLCDEVRRGTGGISNSIRNSSISARVPSSEIFSTLNQLSQILKLLQREELKVSFGVLGPHSLSELGPCLKSFQIAFEESDYKLIDQFAEEPLDILIYVPVDIHATKHVEHLARLSLIAPRTRHVAFTQVPRWTHAQLLALRETWEWVEPRNSNKCLSLAEELIRMNGGEFSKDQFKTSNLSSIDVVANPVILTRSPKMKEILALVDAVADTDSTILITGGSGTGKELIAQRIHCHSHRVAQRMVAVNCGAIPSELLESELFGHVKGAFTGAISNRAGRFQIAEKGTLFLDEIGEMGGNLQVKLLRVLQTRKYEPVGSTQSRAADVRIIAATNRDLEQEVKEGRFREDLFYRLNVIPVHIPELKERKEDIQLLVEHFVRRFNAEKSRRVTGVTRASLRALVAYDWPGNVRELENLMERMVILKSSGMIDVLDFPEKYRRVSFSEIEYDDLMNASKATLKNSWNQNSAGLIPQFVSQPNGGGIIMKEGYNNFGPMNEHQSVQNVNYQQGEEGMIKNTGIFSKGTIEQSAQPNTTGQQNQSVPAAARSEELHIEGSLAIEQIIRLAADKMVFPVEGLDFNSIVDQFENILILQALERTGWNRNRAAGLLRLNRTTLVEKLKKKQLVPPMRMDTGIMSGNA